MEPRVLNHPISRIIRRPDQEPRLRPRVRRDLDAAVPGRAVGAGDELLREVLAGDEAHEVEQVHEDGVDADEGRVHEEGHCEGFVGEICGGDGEVGGWVLEQGWSESDDARLGLDGWVCNQVQWLWGRDDGCRSYRCGRE